MALITIKGNLITFETARGAEFLRSQGKNDVLHKHLISMFDTLLFGTEEVLRTAEHKKDSSEIMKYIGNLEEKQKTMMQEMLSQQQNAMKDMVGSLSVQLLSLLNTVDNAVRGAVDKLNSSDIAINVQCKLENWLSNTFKENNKDVEHRVADEIRKTVLDPLEKQQDLLRSLPHEISTLCASINNTSFVEGKELILERVNDLRTKLSEGLVSHTRDIVTLKSKLTELNEKTITSMEAGKAQSKSVAQIPMLVKGLMSDTLCRLEKGSKGVAGIVTDTGKQLNRLELMLRQVSLDTTRMQKSGDDVQHKVDDMNKQLISLQSKTHTIGTRGKIGEDNLYDALCNKLSCMDYEIEQVSGQARACDLLIKKVSKPDIRVEIKAHGEGTAEKVRMREVQRFKTDLQGLKTHGIFISVHSGIVGKGKVSIEQLGSGKWAVFLAENNNDVDIINDMLQLIYRLDQLSEDDDKVEKGMRISRESMRKVELLLCDYGNKIKQIRTHLRESMSILNDIVLDGIEKELKGNQETEKKPEQGDFICEKCQKRCASKSGLITHMRSHRNDTLT